MAAVLVAGLEEADAEAVLVAVFEAVVAAAAVFDAVVLAAAEVLVVAGLAAVDAAVALGGPVGFL